MSGKNASQSAARASGVEHFPIGRSRAKRVGHQIKLQSLNPEARGMSGPHLAAGKNLPRRSITINIRVRVLDKKYFVTQTNFGFSGPSEARDVKHFPPLNPEARGMSGSEPPPTEARVSSSNL